MRMMRYNPMREFEAAASEFDNFTGCCSHASHKPFITNAQFVPGIDILEDEKNLYFEAELPGIQKEDVKISINDEKILTIKGEKKFDGEKEIKTCCRNERLYGSFNRSFQLPDLLEPDKASARYERGMLFLTIPKMQPDKPKEVEVSIS